MTAKRSVDPVARAAVKPARPMLVPDSGRSIPGEHVERNPGTALDLDVVRAVRVNRSAVERRAATIPTRRTVKRD
jgi:deoxyribose-phosphate aldolase